MNEWQPIETAPKDAVVLLASSDGYMGQGYWQVVDGDDGYWEWGGHKPDFWMPPPPVPPNARNQRRRPA